MAKLGTTAHTSSHTHSYTHSYTHAPTHSTAHEVVAAPSDELRELLAPRLLVRHKLPDVSMNLHRSWVEEREGVNTAL